MEPSKLTDRIKCAHDKIVELIRLQPHPRNPNKHPDRQIEILAKIIDHQGQRMPIVVSKRSGFIVAGHGRLMALTRLGWTSAAVDYQDFENDADEYAHMVADNKIAELAKHDDAMMIEDIKAFEFDDFEILGLDGFQLELFELERPGENDVPKNVDTRCKLGDLWTLGQHRLLCGDATAITDIDRLMGGVKPELCFTSPPYSDQRDYSGQLDLDPKHLANFLMAPCEVYAVNLGLKRNDNEIIPYWDNYIELAKSLKLKLLSWNIWNRQGFGFSIGNATATFPIEHEFIFIFGKPKVTNFVVENKSSGRTDDYQTIRLKDGSTLKRKGTKIKNKRPLGTVLHIGQEAERTIDHPAKFPVELPEIYINALTSKNGFVYDPFGGSGSTLIACEKTKRQCFMMELDPHYCSVILSRWEKFSGKTAELVPGMDKN